MAPPASSALPPSGDYMPYMLSRQLGPHQEKVGDFSHGIIVRDLPVDDSDTSPRRGPTYAPTRPQPPPPPAQPPSEAPPAAPQQKLEWNVAARVDSHWAPGTVPKAHERDAKHTRPAVAKKPPSSGLEWNAKSQVDARAPASTAAPASACRPDENVGRASSGHAIRGVSVSTPRVGVAPSPGFPHVDDAQSDGSVPAAAAHSSTTAAAPHHSFAPSLSPSSHQLRVPGRSAADEEVASQRTTYATNVQADSVMSHREAAFSSCIDAVTGIAQMGAPYQSNDDGPAANSDGDAHAARRTQTSLGPSFATERVNTVSGSASKINVHELHGPLCRWCCRVCGFHNSTYRDDCIVCREDRSKASSEQFFCMCDVQVSSHWRTVDAAARGAVDMPHPQPVGLDVPGGASRLHGMAFSASGNADHSLQRVSDEASMLSAAAANGHAGAADAFEVLAAALRRASRYPMTACVLSSYENAAVRALASSMSLAQLCGFVGAEALDTPGERDAVLARPASKTSEEVALLRAIAGLMQRWRPTASELARAGAPVLRAPLMRCPPSFRGLTSADTRMWSDYEKFCDRIGLMPETEQALKEELAPAATSDVTSFELREHGGPANELSNADRRAA